MSSSAEAAFSNTALCHDSIFFSQHKALVLVEREKKSGCKDFLSLAKTIGQRWKQLSCEEQQRYKDLAEGESERYRKERIAQLLQTRYIAEAVAEEDRPLVQNEDALALAGSTDTRPFLFFKAKGDNHTQVSMPALEVNVGLATALTWLLPENAVPRPEGGSQNDAHDHQSVLPPHSILHTLSSYRLPVTLSMPIWDETLSLVPPRGSLIVDRWDSVALRYALWLRRQRPNASSLLLSDFVAAPHHEAGRTW